MRPWTLAAAALPLLAFGACEEGRGTPTGSRPPLGQGGAVPIPPTGGFVGPSSSSGSGTPDPGERIEDPEGPCDANLDLDSDDPRDGARAIGLCKDAADDTDWGVISAEWTLGDGSPAPSDADYHLGHGLLEGFGDEVEPREGQRGLVLSSGTARAPGDPGYSTPAGFDKMQDGATPVGFPKESEACPDVVTGPPFDDAALEVTMRAPPEAAALAFDFAFFTYEWPEFVCSEFNDFFVAILAPQPDGQDDGNISFDALGNPVSVNAAFVGHCDCAGGPPCQAPPMMPILSYECDEGDGILDGTGFEASASTGWLRTLTPVVGGDVVQVRFAIYDSGDGILDSTVFIDDFRWLDQSGGDGPVTEPR